MEIKPTNLTVNNPDFSFGKKERLCSKKVIEKLFSEGESFLSFPLKVVYLKTPLSSDTPVQIAFTASKKAFKKAVHRNLIKRRMRESYRLNKQLLEGFSSENQMAIFIIFIGKEIPEYSVFNQSMKKALKKLSNLNASYK